MESSSYFDIIPVEISRLIVSKADKHASKNLSLAVDDIRLYELNVLEDHKTMYVLISKVLKYTEEKDVITWKAIYLDIVSKNPHLITPCTCAYYKYTIDPVWSKFLNRIHMEYRRPTIEAWAKALEVKNIKGLDVPYVLGIRT